ncbi:hypothetical protein J2857_006181 [Neorhizobium galegae]|uniref:hypothetical protein n=1 Tax=Neorhizobium galegae TaxID=399 RepID=UPI001AE22E29|nr:hypothetical protein [Neorhizobium galegae]MBP2563382.1 hypothetical protein [Neorhizobium galegae]
MSNPAVTNLIELFREYADNFIMLQEQASIIERDETVSPAIREASAEIMASLNKAYGTARFIMNQKDHDAGSSVTDL